MRKVGGLYHWRIGPLGGSIYLSKRHKLPLPVEVALAAGLGLPLDIFIAEIIRRFM